MINLPGLLEIYDFDRCTGTISNPITIHTEPTTAPFNRFWSCEFSNSGRFLYVSTYDLTCNLFQYDLFSSNPSTSRFTLDFSSNYLIGYGFLKRAPNNKIYFSIDYQCDISPYCYPYPDSVYNQYNMNLSVINFPDSLGLDCGYSPNSFYLGGKRTYYGLPNNPDYDMPALGGSPCDSLTSISEIPVSVESNLFVYYSINWQTAFINADKLKGHTYTLEIFDLLGKSIFRENGKLNPPYYTKNLNCEGFEKGMYVVRLQTEKEELVKKFVVQ